MLLPWKYQKILTMEFSPSPTPDTTVAPAVGQPAGTTVDTVSMEAGRRGHSDTARM